MNNYKSQNIPFNYVLEHGVMGKSVAVTIHHRKRTNLSESPHNPVKQWRSQHKVPWFAFIEIAMMILYFIFGAIHQNDQVQLSLSFTRIVNSYFLDGYDFPEAEEDTNRRICVLYTPEKFVYVTNTTAIRLFSFPDDVLYAYSLNSSNPVIYEVETLSGISQQFSFDKNNCSMIEDLTSFLVKRFKTLTISRKYSIYRTIGSITQLHYLTIFATFDKDKNSNIIKLQMSHIYNFGDSSKKFSGNLDYLKYIPILISILSMIVIVLNIQFTIEMWNYSGQKSLKTFEKHSSIFWRKYDLWAIFSFFSHIITIISCLSYAFSQQIHDKGLSYTFILLSFSSLLHSCLMIRYLSVKPSTLIFVNVLFHGGWNVLQFLFGCIIFFYSYLLFGCSFFGTFSQNFATFWQGDIVLIAVIHGVSIQSMYDGIIDHADISWIWGFIYMTIWIFFSLTVMFNISISIFEEALKTEIYKAIVVKSDDVEEKNPLDQLAFALPVNYSKIF